MPSLGQRCVPWRYEDIFKYINILIEKGVFCKLYKWRVSACFENKHSKSWLLTGL